MIQTRTPDGQQVQVTVPAGTDGFYAAFDQQKYAVADV